MNSYSLDIGSYRRDTAELKVIEHGAYRLLLDEYYATGRALPIQMERLYRICRALDRWERTAVDTVLAKFFQLTDAGYIQKRAEQELSKRGKAAEASRDNGAAGGRSQKPSRFLFPFQAPSFLEVLSYMRELQILNADKEAEKFINYHAQRKWRLNHGKGAVMEDWRRAAVTWKTNMDQFSGAINGKKDEIKKESQVGAGPELTISYCQFIEPDTQFPCGRTWAWHKRAERLGQCAHVFQRAEDHAAVGTRG